ncbi:hypothetical protein PD885_03420 [Xanthomonas fragariae]|uniref:Uncharacterized protein n=1 Tax=Xanthomonas fragariae TaxID=48664 RepID=A0ABY1RTM0_9XANT|nr:hypothetical protein PD885_03420 [Xanthomonas fragariae]
MRFRPDEPIADAGIFVHSALLSAARLPVRLVCIVQCDGVGMADAVAQSIDWARNCGVTQVIFRELSRLDDAYRSNGTWRYVEQHRIGVESWPADCMQQPRWSSRWMSSISAVVDADPGRRLGLGTARPPAHGRPVKRTRL